MTEFLIQKSPIKGSTNDSDSSSGKDRDDLFKFDIVKETLKRIHPRSKLKKTLAFILSKFYSCQISIIFVSFIFGFLTFGLPLLFIYNGLLTNIIIPILIISVIALIFSLILIIIHIVDGKINKAVLIVKWERKIILKNIRIIFNLIFLIASISLSIIFYSKSNYFIKMDRIKMEYKDNFMLKKLKSDFLFKYILNMIIYNPSEIDKDYEGNEIKYFFSNNDIEINILRKKIMALLIPLLILSFIKTVKCILIEVKYPIERFIFFFGAFLFFMFNTILFSYKNNKIEKSKYLSCFQIILIGITYIGYISWLLHNSFRFIRNPKDKNFAIRKYKFINLLLILFFDLISFLGASAFFLSILYFYCSTINENETFKKLKISFFILKISFLLIIFGNSYYFGHYLLSMIFRPITIQYVPYELKNKNYIKANRKLINYINTRKIGLKLKDVKNQ